jgi:hypothetical protein
VRVAGGQRHQQGGQRFGQRVVVSGIGGGDHLRHARQGGSCGGALGIGAGDEDMDLAQRGCGGDSGARGLLDRAAFMVEEDENGHAQITFASSLSFSTSSATDFTFTPATRFGGSATLIVVRRGAGSTPRSAGLIVSIGFLRAFMMFGSEA